MFVFALTIFTSAFLLFLVQPMIGKFILPWFGGGPGIWTTCMLFFQLVLLGGYAYAHALTRWTGPRKQVIVHLTLLAIAMAMLPITPSDSWKPSSSGNPRQQILLLLAASVGVPYLALSASGPLLQHWFSRVQPGASPYRLYALSNLGSLLALFAYPFFFELHFTRKVQASQWTWAWGAFALLSTGCALRVWRSAMPAPELNRPKAVTPSDPPLPSVSRFSTFIRKLLWLLLPACASVLLIATTNKLCQDVTVIPLLWVMPLGLYLLSFIICFDDAAWYRRLPFGLALALALAGICWVLFQATLVPLTLQLLAYSAGLFVCCMVCHGELYRLRPPADQLTGYYLLISAGGALGGVFVTLGAPWIFADYYELHWGLLLCAGLFLMTWHHNPEWGRFGKWRWQAYGCGILAVAGLGLALWLQARQTATLMVSQSRNFYGVLSVLKVDPSQSSLYGLKLVHGITTHGLQLQDPALQSLPTTYYSESSGVGRVLRSLPGAPRRIGVIGLGAGTLATYSRSNDVMRLYEINPEVERLARQHFTFLSACTGQVDVVLGDARLSLERESPQHFDLLIVDAFSSDAIPMHLLTQEAFALYRSHLTPNGLLAVHISNRHLNLEPVVATVASNASFESIVIRDEVADDKWWLTTSVWMILSRDPEFFSSSAIAPSARPARADPGRIPLWTDDYASIYPILKAQYPGKQELTQAEERFAAAITLTQQGEIAGAIQRYRSALEINPDFAEAQNNLAWLLATSSEPALRNGADAVQWAERACRLTDYRRTVFLGSLAAAYAESGRFSEAVAMAEKACAIASESGDEVLLTRNRQLLDLYRTGKPYHER